MRKLMAGRKQKQNTFLQNHGKKPLIAAVSVICALVAVIVTFLALKNTLYFSLAQKKAEKSEFSQALHLVEKSGGEEAKLLERYLALRFDINRSYPELISEFDIDKINEWKAVAEELCGEADILGEKIGAETQLLHDRLVQISDSYAGYQAIRSEVLNMMDVFAEFNRLYTVAADGKNTAFTVEQERQKIDEWEQQNSALMSCAAVIPGYENIYLLNYLIKEVQGECSDLREAMDKVVEMGYTETDLIRLSGTAEKKFPSIQNSNSETVNVLEKETYEQYMFKSICSRLTESLGEFYSA